MLTTLVLMAAFCCGVKKAFADGMLLSGLHAHLSATLHPSVHKPLLNCIYCFASTYGTVAYLLLGGRSVGEGLALVVGCVFANGLLWYALNVLTHASTVLWNLMQQANVNAAQQSGWRPTGKVVGSEHFKP